MSQIKEKKHVSVSDFKAHCTQHLHELEKNSQTLLITRHGKIIAEVARPSEIKQTPKTLGQLMGKLSGSVKFPSDYDEEEPTWPEDEWPLEQDPEA